jgi:predicted XRE-type DNA-binding protein
MNASMPTGLRFQVLERDEFTCQYCGAKAPDAILNVDHVVAESKGGPTTADNLITSCRDCNFGKANGDLKFIPDHILERAGTAYARGALIRAEVMAATNPELTIPAEPRDAPEVLVQSITSDQQAIAVSIEAARLTQAYVAGALGISNSYISCLVSGKRPMPDKLVPAFCAATGTNLVRQYRELRCAESDIARLAEMLRAA